VICDNQGTIQRIEKMRNAPFISARMTTTDDFDIYQAILQTDKQLYPLTFSYFHIKGYQDKSRPFHQLSPEAQLNVECDRRAGSLLPKLLRFHKPVHLPPFYFCKPLYSWTTHCQGLSIPTMVCSLLARLSTISMPEVSVEARR